MREVQKLRELLERVEAVAGADVGTDVAIYHALRPATIEDLRAMHDAGDVAGYWYWMGHHPVTASLDASIALVERMLPGWHWVAGKNDDNECICLVGGHSDDHVGPEFEGRASTVPLAILSACLRALISQAEGEAQHG